MSSKAAYHAWKELGAAGVGASFWNLAMFNIKYGRSDVEEDQWTTHWLRSASIVGLHEAGQLLAAGEEEYSRLLVLAELGDPGAAMTVASAAHHAGNTSQKLWALSIAANAGDVYAMSNLGLELIGENQEGAEKWLTLAADQGEIAAANRLGDCYNRSFYFCEQRNLELAAHYYEIALGPVPPYAPPKIYMGSDYAIRLGTTARWISRPLGHAESAAYELGKLYMSGTGVPIDLVRAEELFLRADGRRDSDEILAQLRGMIAAE
ncbi:tetratricopeptide repeat protein [Aliiroseovarius sp. S253]|uniref:tetratricopeptide repeat protein n=1 Tax=Aliiroseovarius sp. S253 TaxID=3415133 RepID=UPI003C7BC4BB